MARDAVWRLNSLEPRMLSLPVADGCLDTTRPAVRNPELVDIHDPVLDHHVAAGRHESMKPVQRSKRRLVGMCSVLDDERPRAFWQKVRHHPWQLRITNVGLNEPHIARQAGIRVYVDRYDSSAAKRAEPVPEPECRPTRLDAEFYDGICAHVPHEVLVRA